MDKDKLLPQPSAIILEEQTDLTISEVCQACAVRVETIVELVDEGVLDRLAGSRTAGVSPVPTCGVPRSPSGCNAISASIWPALHWPCNCSTNSKPCKPGCARPVLNENAQG